jgi:hypothetical protein
MEQIPIQRNNAPKPVAQNVRVDMNDITGPQEQQGTPERLPKSLIEWLARINRRCLSVETRVSDDSG